jgi:hypothetical protein
MKVELIEYTGAPDPERALNILLRTKGTRLSHFEDPATWSAERKAEHLAYMRDTIKSSWEFVDYHFRISGVTRAFTHQLVRTRHGSYAQEAMRVKNAEGFETLMPPSVVEAGYPATFHWDQTMDHIDNGYQLLIATASRFRMLAEFSRRTCSLPSKGSSTSAASPTWASFVCVPGRKANTRMCSGRCGGW